MFAQKKSKRRPKNKSRYLEVNQPLLTSLAKFSLFYLSRFGGRKKKNERKYILSKKYVKYTKQDKIKGKSRLEANQRFLTSLAKLWLLYPLWGAGSSVGKSEKKREKCRHRKNVKWTELKESLNMWSWEGLGETWEASLVDRRTEEKQKKLLCSQHFHLTESSLLLKLRDTKLK